MSLQPLTCPTCKGELSCAPCSVGDALAEARRVVVNTMRKPGRNALVQLQAAKMVLAKDFLAFLSDDDLLAEIRRRNQAAKAQGK